MHWTKWSEDNPVPFLSTEALCQLGTGKKSSNRVGNGEHRLAWELGGQVSSTDTYDVLLPSCQRVEVKELGGFKFTVGGHAGDVQAWLTGLIGKLHDALDHDWTDTRLCTLRDRVFEIHSKSVRYVGKNSVIGRTFKNGKDPILGLRCVIQELHRIRGSDGSDDTVQCIIEGEEVKLSMWQLAGIMSIIGASTEEGFKEIDVLFSRLHDPSFWDTGAVLRQWDSVRPSDALLCHSDLFCIVDAKLGYIFLDEEEIDIHVRFAAFNKGDGEYRTSPDLKRVKVVECDTAGELPDASERDGNDREETQSDTIRTCHVTVVKDGRATIPDRLYGRVGRDLFYLSEGESAGRL